MGLNFIHSSDSTTDFAGQNDREFFFGQNKTIWDAVLHGKRRRYRQTNQNLCIEREGLLLFQEIWSEPSNVRSSFHDSQYFDFLS